MNATGFLRRRARKDTAVVEPPQPPVAQSTRQAVEQAWARGAFPYVIDGGELDSKRAMLDAIAAELSFPEWAGRNLDALYDCLLDLSWLPRGEHVLIWSGTAPLAERDPKAYRKLAEVLCTAARRSEGTRTFMVVCTPG